MASLSRTARRLLGMFAIVLLILAMLPASPAQAASGRLDGTAGCPSGALICLPFLQIIWGTPTSDPANGIFNMSLDRPGDGSVTLSISQLQVRVSYTPTPTTPPSPPPNAPPTAPTAVNQYRTDGTTVIAAAGLTNETQVVFKATAADPESDQYKLEVEVVLADGVFSDAATCSSPLVDSGSEASTGPCGEFVDGSAYKWQYRVVDSAGAATTWTPFGASDPDFVIDMTGPTITLNSTPAAISGPSVQFDFMANDAAGIASFQCQLDGAGFAPCTPAASFDSLADGTHTFEVLAIDQAGNTGTPASFTWTVDAIPPTVTITASPTNPSNVASPTFGFTGDDGTGSGVASFQCQVDSAGFMPCASGDVFGPLVDSSHTFDVEAIDNVGNVSSPASGTWVVDTTAPTVTITTSPANPSDLATATFEFTGDDGTGSGVAGFQCQLDMAGFTPCKSGDSFGPLADGSHAFEVQAIDNAANVGTPASFTWSVATPPALGVTIQSGPSDPTNSTTASFTFSASGSPTAVECALDGGAFAACESSTAQSYAGPLAEGSHTFVVRVTDAAAHTSSASLTWTVDTMAPLALITSSPTDPTNVATAKFEFTGDDGTGSGVAGFQCQLDAAGFAACNSGDSFGPLSDGSHTFEVEATDRAGNTGAPASFTWIVDTTPPTASISGTPASFTGASARIEFTGEDVGGIASFECKLDGGGFALCTSPVDLVSLSDGAQTFQVQATDRAGNVGSPVSLEWTVDTVGPTTTLTVEPAAVSSEANPTFEFTADDGSGSGVASFQCQLDSAAFAPCTSPAAFGPLADGPHTLSLFATDNVGNVGPTVTYSWTISTVVPSPTP